ncbi:MAG TPA: recombinase family protein [Verrucomicrobiae bacterium]|nr:recombinase family protein [Verrucomicrobiae bacterium]
MIGYARVSTGDQDNRRQKDALEAFGVDPRDIWEDKASGRSMNRAGWQGCWRDIRAGDLLVVHSIDRLGRDLIELVRTVRDLHERGANLKVLTMDIDTRTATGRLLFNFIAALAEWERDLIVERTRHGLAVARSMGRLGGRRQQITDEQVKQAICRLHKGETLEEIAKDMGFTKQGISKRIRAAQAKESADGDKS